MPDEGLKNNPPNTERLNIKPFSTGFVKTQIEQLLGSVELIKTVKSVEVTVNAHNQMRMDISVVASGFNVKVTASLENSSDSLTVKEYEVDAMWPAKGKAEKAIKPHLDNVGKLLKDYIEKTENQKVLKIEIKNGQLEVTFEKKAEVVTEIETPKQAENKENREQKKSYKSTLRFDKGRGYVDADNNLIYYETPDLLIIDGYQVRTNTKINNVVGGEIGFIAFHDGSRFDYKTGKLELAHEDGSTEITVRKLSKKELAEIKEKNKRFEDKMTDKENVWPEKRPGFTVITNKIDGVWYGVEYSFAGDPVGMSSNKNKFIFKNVAEVDLRRGTVTKLPGWKDEYEINIIKQGDKTTAEENDLIPPNTPPPSVESGKSTTENETLPPGVFSAEQIKDIVFDLLEEEGKTPESYEIAKDTKGIQTFVLKFTDGTTNEHSVRGVLGLRLKVPIYDIEGIEPVDGGKNFRLIWRDGIENETTEEGPADTGVEKNKSAKEIELEKLIARKEEIAKEKERIAKMRAELLKKLEEMEKNRK